MKEAYPAIMTPDDFGYLVTIPDFSINSQGRDLAEAIEMARDAIGIMGIDMEDEGETLPSPSELSAIQKTTSADFLTLVDVDFAEYRRQNDMRTVRKNCTIPSWLNAEAEKAGVNFSAVLQDGLKRELRISAQ